MTDLEITKLCAEAMRWHVEAWHGTIETNPIQYYIFDGNKPVALYDPLHDDSQAMALVKRFPFETLAAMTKHMRISANVPEMVERALGLNRAICECVAKMEKQKVAA